MAQSIGLRFTFASRQQKYQDMDCIEHFTVLGCGTYFALQLPKVDSLHTYSNMAHELSGDIPIGGHSKKLYGAIADQLVRVPFINNLIVVGRAIRARYRSAPQPIFTWKAETCLL